MLHLFFSFSMQCALVSMNRYQENADLASAVNAQSKYIYTKLVMQLTESLPGLDFPMCQSAANNVKGKGYHSCTDNGGDRQSSTWGEHKKETLIPPGTAQKANRFVLCFSFNFATPVLETSAKCLPHANECSNIPSETKKRLVSDQPCLLKRELY